MNKQITDYVVVAGTEGFTDIQTGEVHDVDTMLTLFTVDDLARVRLVSRLVRPLLQQSRARDLHEHTSHVLGHHLFVVHLRGSTSNWPAAEGRVYHG
jgi:hypothetical protein